MKIFIAILENGWLSKYLDELLGPSGSDYFLLLIGSWLIYSAKRLSAKNPNVLGQKSG